MHNSQLHEEILTRKDSEDLITIMTKQQMEDMQERVKELARVCLTCLLVKKLLTAETHFV